MHSTRNYSKKLVDKFKTHTYKSKSFNEGEIKTNT